MFLIYIVVLQYNKQTYIVQILYNILVMCSVHKQKDQTRSNEARQGVEFNNLLYLSFRLDIKVAGATRLAKNLVMEGTIPIAKCRDMIGYNEIAMTVI